MYSAQLSVIADDYRDVADCKCHFKIHKTII